MRGCLHLLHKKQQGKDTPLASNAGRPSWSVQPSPPPLCATACLPQVVLDALLLRHRPELTRQLLQHAKLPGESDEAATARWRQLAVRSNQPGGLIYTIRVHRAVPSIRIIYPLASDPLSISQACCRFQWVSRWSRRASCEPPTPPSAPACSSWAPSQRQRWPLCRRCSRQVGAGRALLAVLARRPPVLPATTLPVALLCTPRQQYPLLKRLPLGPP
jgi:hypothetical protein